MRDHKNDAAMHAKWSFALAHALALRKVRIIKLPVLYLTAMFIESPRVLDYALDCLDLPHCCSTTQSNLVVQFIVGAAITKPCCGWWWLLHLLGVLLLHLGNIFFAYICFVCASN